jgi:hypothetical protein
MKLTTPEFAYVRSQGLYITEKCNGCGTLLNQKVRFTINGKLQRFHETLRFRLSLLVFTSPEALRAAMAEFIEFYNHRPYHEGIGNVTPADVSYGRGEENLTREKEQKQDTLDRRFQYNLGQAPKQTRGELGSDL